ncbi:MAG: hypothetical protein IH576_00035 [Deltaproteobacteria bacterium]|nr:hypothetical protein [Deltaproteobacteria bacterium]
MNVRKACSNFYWKAQKIIAPSLRYSQYLYEEVLFSHMLPPLAPGSGDAS